MIAIIDYGMGNLRSVQKALEAVGASATITQSPKDIEKAEKVVLPGVGAMGPAMERLKALRLISCIQETVASGKPFLGICLGLQLLFESSTEGGLVEGLGVFAGGVERFSVSKVPHMGWNRVKIQKSRSRLFVGCPEGSHFYFCHSYFVRPQDPSLVSTTTDYGVEFTSSVERDCVFGVQFHPEKSQSAGLKLLKNFLEVAQCS